MLEKRNSLCKSMVNIYFWCTICAIPLLILSYPIAIGCLLLGANSLFVALSYGGFDDNMLMVRFCGFWIIGFLIILILVYILAIKKRWYIPFLVAMFGDTLFVCLSAVLELSRDNMYGLGIILPDVLVSLIICSILIYAIHKYRKEVKALRETTDN